MANYQHNLCWFFNCKPSLLIKYQEKPQTNKKSPHTQSSAVKKQRYRKAGDTPQTTTEASYLSLADYVSMKADTIFISSRSMEEGRGIGKASSAEVWTGLGPGGWTRSLTNNSRHFQAHGTNIMEGPAWAWLHWTNKRGYFNHNLMRLCTWPGPLDAEMLLQLLYSHLGIWWLTLQLAATVPLRKEKQIKLRLQLWLITALIHWGFKRCVDPHTSAWSSVKR